MRKYVLVTVLAFAIHPSAAWTNPTASDSCASPEQASRFVEEFRHALVARDAVRLAALVDFPLRINREGQGSILLLDPIAFHAEFAEIFTDEWIHGVIASLHPLNCDGGPWETTKYAVGDGAAYVNEVEHDSGSTYRVKIINGWAPNNKANDFVDQAKFYCETKRHRILIDSVGHETTRYRAWNQPRNLFERPDLVLEGGEAESVGTGPCRHWQWNFENGNTSYSVGPLGCVNHETPDWAVGRVFVESAKGTILRDFCF
jgi:hypothetical protein